MGKIDYSFLQGQTKRKIASSKRKPSFGGSFRRLEQKKDFLINQRHTFLVRKQGSILTLKERRGVTKFNDRGATRRDPSILLACKMVLDSIKKYEAANDKIPSGNYTTSFINQMFTTEYILGGGRKISLVDIKHCYWRIAYIFGLIGDKLYEKFKDQREARLIAIGNLTKPTTDYYYLRGNKIKQETSANPHKWAWDFILWKANTAVNSVRVACANNIFAYHTDGIYMPFEYVNEAQTILSSYKLNSEIKNFEVVGYESHFLILRNLETGKHKRANLGISNALKVVLPRLDFSKLDEDDDTNKP